MVGCGEGKELRPEVDARPAPPPFPLLPVIWRPAVLILPPVPTAALLVLVKDHSAGSERFD